MNLLINTFATILAGTMLAIGVFAQSTVVSINNEPAPSWSMANG